VQVGGLIVIPRHAPKLYKEFTGEHLTIVSWDGQTLRWKVGIPFYD